MVESLKELMNGWQKPERTYKPHTRWWWPGNALTKDDITFQMEQMANQGMGGVEIMSSWSIYKKGNIDYLSKEHLELLRHAVAEGKRLDMEVAITFSPGWSFGGGWVKKEDQSKCLSMADFETEGPAAFSGKLPEPDNGKGDPADIFKRAAVVAAKVIEDNSLAFDSLILLDPYVDGEGVLSWNVPEGKWRIMSFYIVFTGQICQANSFEPLPKIVDHLNKNSVRNYCEYLGGVFKENFGEEFGKTVDSYFCDSFEVMPLRHSVLWGSTTLEDFEETMGYDFKPYLPAIWYNVPPHTENLRYDINYFLHLAGLESVYETFGGWCKENNVQARIQPHYRFTTEIVKAAGSVARPETEVTTTKYETIADPRKATASGCRFYGQSHMSAEAYTFIHKYRYRTDLKELKIATDAFLRDGVTQFYNHGFIAAVEDEVAPTRDMPWANHINYRNTWWKYYHHLAEYIARSCFMLRQGKFVADVLLYTPQNSLWTKTVLWGGQRRVAPYGDLPKLLLTCGYDYDIVNDDLLQNLAEFSDGKATINGHSYRVLIMPAIHAIPVKTMEAIQKFVNSGGVVIALEKLPQIAPGLKNSAKNNEELSRLVSEIFNGEAGSSAYFIPEYAIVEKTFDPEDQEEKPVPEITEEKRKLLDIISRYVRPDIMIDDGKQSTGLTFIHNRYKDIDIYFVTNLQPRKFKGNLTFKVKDKQPQIWDAVSGKIFNEPAYTTNENGVTVEASFNEWESAFYIFTPENKEQINKEQDNKKLSGVKLPDPIEIKGAWKLSLKSACFEDYESDIIVLSSWTDNDITRHFSGTGRYDINVNVPADYISDSWRLIMDLGDVGMIAEFIINGKNVHTAWMPPYRADVTDYLKSGDNHITILVTNVLLNRVNGFTEPPEVQENLQERLGTGSAFLDKCLAENNTRWLTAMFYEMKMDKSELPASGLMGPVRIIPEI